MPCDVASDEEINAVFSELGKHWDGLDIIVHAAAYATWEQLEGEYLDTVTREGFRMAQDISAYSFAALAKADGPCYRSGGSQLMVEVIIENIGN